MSEVELDKISYPEIKGHLADHVTHSSCYRLHWLKPGCQLSDGLLLLTDDASCQWMADNMTDGGAADIYVEEVYGMQCAEQSPEKKDKDWRSFMQFYRSPPKISQDYNEAEGYMSGRSEMSELC